MLPTRSHLATLDLTVPDNGEVVSDVKASGRRKSFHLHRQITIQDHLEKKRVDGHGKTVKKDGKPVYDTLPKERHETEYITEYHYQNSLVLHQKVKIKTGKKGQTPLITGKVSYQVGTLGKVETKSFTLDVVVNVVTF